MHQQANRKARSPHTQHKCGWADHCQMCRRWHSTGDPPRQHRGVRGRLQTALDTESARSAYAACNRVGSAEMPARLLNNVAHGSSPRGSPRNFRSLSYPPTIALSLSSCVSPVITHYRYLTQRANSILSYRHHPAVFHTSIPCRKDSSEIVLYRHHLAI
jgi:hypothetical protein